MSERRISQHSPSVRTAADGAPGASRRVTSAELLGEALALVIVHNGREYILRVTQNGKLILTA
jgi:hemin uptake protein HemP